VQRARAASIASSSRLLVPERAASFRALRHTATRAASRLARILARRSTWLTRTAVLSIASTSIGVSSFKRNLLTPTMTSEPESIMAWRRAAASSMRSLGMPLLTALAMPPSCSTSRMMVSAAFSSSSVRLSIAYEPANGSMIYKHPASEE